MNIYILNDLILSKNQGINTTTEKIKYCTSGHKVLRAKNILDNKIDESDLVYIDDNTYDTSNDNYKPKIDDVLYTNIGSQFGSACVLKTNDYFITWNILRLVPNKKLISPLYLSYLLNSNKERLRNLNSSSTMPFVSGNILCKEKFNIHSLEEQQHIVNIIGSIDDLIENLNLINLKFHELGISIIKKNVNGNEYNSKISDVSSISSGKSTKKNTSGKYQIIGANGCLGYTDNFNINEKIIITGRVGTIGTFSQYDKAIWCSDNTLIIRTNYFNYLFYYLNVFFDSDSLNRGSTQPLITQTDLLNYEIFIPKNIDEIENELETIYSKIKNNNIKISMLMGIKKSYLKKFFG